MTTKKKTYVYIDGFNLYYGAVKDTKYKWLDLHKLSESILPNDYEIAHVRYFTAPIIRRPKSSAPERQMAYINALKKHTPSITVHLGKFTEHSFEGKIVKPQSSKEYETVTKATEKHSDVNLAAHLINDAWRDSYDCALLISNDSDFKEALLLAKKECSKEIAVANPSGQYPSHVLQQHADLKTSVTKGALEKSQLPINIPGTNISKPPDWN